MNVSRNNLKFEYLYRDAGNYKQFGQIVMLNPSKLDLKTATSKIKDKLIDGEFFDPSKVRVPKLEVFDFNPEIDHEWYEFQKFSFTNEKPTEIMNVETFIDQFS